MASLVFYRKWRPQTLSELVGQPHITQTLLNALKNSHISHAYLFCGPRGTGKTSTGRILAKAVNCQSNGQGEPCNNCQSCRAISEDRALDVIEIDAASNRGIDDIRDLREKVNYAPNHSRYKVYIIDEFHMLSKDAANALLKTLEEPPPQVIFILATTEAHKILPTILSRCQRFDFRRLSQGDVVGKLAVIAGAEGITIDAQSLKLIAKSTTGSLRDAENLLEQLFTYHGAIIQLTQVQAMLGITGDWRAREIVKSIVENDISSGMGILSKVSHDGLDLRQFNRELIEYLRDLLLLKTGSPESIDVTTEDLAELKIFGEKTNLAQILKALKLFGQIDLGNDNTSILPLELALVDCFLTTEGEKRLPVIAPLSDNLAIPKMEGRVAGPPRPRVTASESVKNKPDPVSLEVRSQEAERAVSTPQEASPLKETAVSSAPTLSSEIERLRLNWKQIIEEVSPVLKKSKAIALLRSGSKPVSIEGDTVVLSFGFSIHKDIIEKPENQRITEKIVSDYLGRACKVRCVYEKDNNHMVRAAIKLGGQVTNVEER